MRSVMTGLLAVVALFTLCSPAANAAPPAVCVGEGLNRQMEAKCRTTAPPATKPATSGQGSAPARASEPMVWIRFALFSTGTGSVGETCRLWPASDPLPLNHARVSAEDCGFESAVPSRADVERLVRGLAATLEVPEPTIRLGPEPSVNEWDMAVVGLPVWLWTEVPRSVSSTNTGSGMTISLTASLDRLVFDLGDGSQVACGQWTAYVPANAGEVSPTCGYVYQKPSPPQADYTLMATAEWTAQWSAMGYSGTLPLRSSATRSVAVGELQAVVVRGR